MKSIIILYSYHHNNTEKVAKVIAKVLDAEIRSPKEVTTDELQEYDMVGFGSGIYGEKHHKLLLELADKLPQVKKKKAFLFSTSGVPKIGWSEEKVAKDHKKLREKLESKGYEIIDEFGCLGFNTNSFTKFFGGINKGRPNKKDLKRAKKFAKNLKESSEGRN